MSSEASLEEERELQMAELKRGKAAALSLMQVSAESATWVRLQKFRFVMFCYETVSCCQS